MPEGITSETDIVADGAKQLITHTVEEWHEFRRFIDVEAVDDEDALRQVAEVSRPQLAKLDSGPAYGDAFEVTGSEWMGELGTARVIKRAFHELDDE